MNLDILGLLLLLAGFIIGLGAVTVIDIHGFLGRTSSYWTEATIRTHKVTKPLIWVGIILASIGGVIFYRHESFAGIPLYQAIAALALVFNGCFLSFWLSPRLLERERQGKAGERLPARWQRAIAGSLIISDIGWWGSLFLLVIYIVRKY
jgi:hypothetical protein